MSSSRPTELLHRIASGDTAAYDELFPLVYAELHRRAQQLMRNEGKSHTLQPTALVHEAYLRLVRTSDAEFDDKRHFLRVAGGAMRRVLVDAARTRRRDKRGGDHVRVSLDELEFRDGGEALDLLALDEALQTLSERDAELAQVVELRFFAGLRHPEIADVLGTSLRSVERQWSLARAWLNRTLRTSLPDER